VVIGGVDAQARERGVNGGGTPSSRSRFHPEPGERLLRRRGSTREGQSEKG
jgi:hypothetical protein